MIEISKLTEADIGRSVTYRRNSVRETGQLSSWNNHFVFVRFTGPNGEACIPEDVTFDDNSHSDAKSEGRP